jgi:hypothetical protein
LENENHHAIRNGMVRVARETQVARPSCSNDVSPIGRLELINWHYRHLGHCRWLDDSTGVDRENLSSCTDREVPRLNTNETYGCILNAYLQSIYICNLSTLWWRSGLKDLPVHSRPKRKNLKEASCLLLLLELPRNVDLGEGGGSISSTNNGY